MKRTKKNKQNKVFKRKTIKRRFNKKGGVQKKCDICGVAFHMTGTVGAPPKSQLYGVELFEDHIKNHPICKYCNTTLLDVNKLIEHINLEHPDKYNTAQKIKFGILNERNLLDELRNRNSSIVGQSPDFNLFYDAIEKKINAKPVIKEVAKPIKKPDVKSKQRENDIRKEEEQKKKEEQLESSRKALAEEQRLLKEAAEKRKKEKLEAAEREAQMLKEQAQKEKIEKEKEKKAAKRLAKDKMIADQESAAMGAEELISKDFNDKLKEAESMKQVIDIIDNNKLSAAASEFVPVQKQKPLRLIDILTEKDFQYLPISKWFIAIQRLYPAMTGYTDAVSSNRMYLDISFFIIFLIGIVNFRLNSKGINLKLILKGGKASQMIMSSYGINNTPILTDDVDILLVQEGVYDYQFLLYFASDFATYINHFFNYQLSVLIPPNPILTNKNIVKISFVYNGFIPLSDIDFKQVESEFLQGENIITTKSTWNVMENKKQLYTYNLLYYHQSLEAFIAEKKYYLQIYDNIIQKKNETEDCDCANIHDRECEKICDYRNKMLDKFNKYIHPLEQIHQTINHK